MLAKPESDLDPGPPEAHFNLEPSELRDETETELQHLRQDKARLEGQLRAALDQVIWKKHGRFEVNQPAIVLSDKCLYVVRGGSFFMSILPLF